MSTIRFRGKPLWALLTALSLALLVGFALSFNSAQASLPAANDSLVPSVQAQTATNSVVGDTKQGASSAKSPSGASPTPSCGPAYTYSTSTATIVPGVDDVGNHCDDCITYITLPFAFTFYGMSYITATVSSNGNLQFTTNNDTQDNFCLPRPDIGPAIFAHWDELVTDESNIPCTPGPCGIYTSVSGSAPNRIFNIEWRTSYYSDPGNAYFEIQLYEDTTSRFDIVLGVLEGSGAVATIGAQDGVGAFTQYECNLFASNNTRIAFTFSPGCVPTPTNTPSPTPCVACTATPTPSGYSYTTSVATIVPGTEDIGNNGDDITTTITLPFAFQLYDQSYTSATVSSNGNLQFVTISREWGNECLPSTLIQGPAIFAHWDDLGTSDFGGCTPGPCGIYTSVSGSAPNRIFNIEWRAFDYVLQDLSTNFEVRLYEGLPSRFDIVMGNVGGGGISATVGVQDGAGARTQFECNAPGGAPSNIRIAFICNVCVLLMTSTPTNTPTITRTPTITFTPTTTNTPVPTNTPSCDVTFEDVPRENNAFPAIRYLYCAGAISGYRCGEDESEPCDPNNNPYFRPNNETTRAQLSKIVVRALHWPINSSSGPHFSDVEPGSTFYDVIETAYAHGIIGGYADGTFRPSDNVTRGQLSKIIVLAMRWNNPCPSGGHFSDVEPDNVFFCLIETAYAHGIIGGYADGTFHPADNATRSQISLIVYRALTNNPLRVK